jgi:hypothetical protein
MFRARRGKMAGLRRLRVLLVLFVMIGGLFGGSAAVSAAPGQGAGGLQGAQEGEGFTLGASAAFCEPGYMGPFVGCTPWSGITVSFVTSDNSVNTTCVTAGSDRAAGCSVVVPFGSTVTVSIDPAVVPAGYELQGAATQTITVPDGPPDGVFGGANFVLLPADGGGEAEVALPVYASLCADGFAPHDDCSPWEGALVTFTADDDTWLGECVTETFFETVAGCEIVVERGTTVVATISLDTLPAEYMLETVQQVVEIPAEGDPEGPMFLAIPVEDEDGFTALPVYASICENALAPNDDCQPWEDVVITAITNDDAEYADECRTETFFETAAGCEISMPRGANVTATISEDQIPEGYELFVEVPTWDMPEEGELESGPYFFLVTSDDSQPSKTPTPKPTATAPVKQLPSTGTGSGQDNGAMLMLVAAAGIVTMGGGVYVYAHRER